MTSENNDPGRPPEPPRRHAGAESSPTAELLAVVYDELRALASAYLRNERRGHTLQTTSLVHEAWLRLQGRDAERYGSRAHYFRAAALAMRRILLHHAEKHAALKRGGGAPRLSLAESHDMAECPEPCGEDLLAVNEALNRLAATDPKKAAVVELRFFGGCSIGEAAEALGVSTATVERDWRFARAWLRAELDDNEEVRPEHDGD